MSAIGACMVRRRRSGIARGIAEQVFDARSLSGRLTAWRREYSGTYELMPVLRPQHVEHCWVERPRKINACAEFFFPAYEALDGLQFKKLYPESLATLYAVDQLDGTTMSRDIAQADLIRFIRPPTQPHFRVQSDPDRSSRQSLHWRTPLTLLLIQAIDDR